MTDEEYPDALPVGHRLHWYVLEHVLGQGGFGITYLARDTNLERRVAIKEYLPSEIARRRSDAAAHPRTEAHSERYAWGLERFLAEARTLARFDHPNIVRVHSVFEANNTAYMVMRFEEGENLAALLDRCGTLTEAQLTGWLLPILDGLELVHSTGFIHRDIKPENIYLRRDGSPVLLDFGSARQSFGSTKTMTILVAPGYAPLEQYYNDAATQGAWTDIYGLGATCYRAIAGRAPLDAIVRAKGVLGSAREVLPPAMEVGRGRYSDRLLAAVDHALQLGERDRPQSVAEWRREFAPAAAVAPSPAVAPAPVAAAVAPAAVPAVPGPPGARRLRPALAAGGVLAGVAALVFATRGAAPPPPVPAAAAAPSPVAVAVAPAPMAAPAPPITAVTAPPPAPSPPPAPAAERSVPVQPSPAPRSAAPPARSVSVREVRPLAAPVSPPPALPSPSPTPPPSPPPAALAAPVPAPAPAVAPQVVALAPPAAAREEASPRSKREEQIDNAEAALRRGEHAAAAQILAPMAAAGSTRAQLLMGRLQEGRPGPQQSDFEAYVWYAVAARNGEAAAAALRDKVAQRLQPAEVQQAGRIVDRWRPRADPSSGQNP